MAIMDRVKAAVAVLTRKNAPDQAEEMTLNQLLNFLGVQRSGDVAAMNEAVYFACCKVLSESVGKLPLKSNSLPRTRAYAWPVSIHFTGC